MSNKIENIFDLGNFGILKAKGTGCHMRGGNCLTSNIELCPSNHCYYKPSTLNCHCHKKNGDKDGHSCALNQAGQCKNGGATHDGRCRCDFFSIGNNHYNDGDPNPDCNMCPCRKYGVNKYPDHGWCDCQDCTGNSPSK